MKKFLLFAFFIAGIFSSQTFTFKTNASDFNNSSKQPVLVELFTSESCFACPPAEKMLTKLENEQPFKDAELITLEFHVDYRDGFGRSDKFASPLFTQRQQVYDRKFTTGKLYTPQMIVDGHYQFAGSKFDKAKKAVKRTVKSKKADVKLSLNDNKLALNVSNLPKHGFLTVYLAVAEDGIITRKSEDSIKNVSIVRRLNGIGRILPSQNSFEMEQQIFFEKDWNKENLKLVAFLQENVSRKILGVGRVSVDATNENRK